MKETLTDKMLTVSASTLEDVGNMAVVVEMASEAEEDMTASLEVNYQGVYIIIGSELHYLVSKLKHTFLEVRLMKYCPRPGCSKCD